MGEQISVVEMAEEEMQKPVVGTFLVGQAKKHDQKHRQGYIWPRELGSGQD